jgi:hypothetical protein
MPRQRDADGEWHDICDACGEELDEGVLRIVAGKVVEVTCRGCREALSRQG